MEQIGMYEARTKFAELVRAVKNGGREFLITSRGEPVAIITQIAAPDRFSSDAAEALMCRISSRRGELAGNGYFLRGGETVNGFGRDGLKW